MPIQNLVIAVCEGPRCKRGANEQRFQVAWDPALAKESPDAVPDSAWQLITTVYFSGEQHLFCSVRCQHDWQLDNKPNTLSPRQQQAIAKTNLEAEAARQGRGKVIQMPATDVETSDQTAGVPEDAPPTETAEPAS